MKKKSFHITIDKPCSESWQNMQPDANGKFCLHCSNSVIDFTQQTSYEIKSYFLHHEKGKTCGRFTNQQLEDTYTIYEVSKFDHYKFVASLTLGLLTLETINAFSIDGKDFKNEKDSVQIVKMIGVKQDTGNSTPITTLGGAIPGIKINQNKIITLRGTIVDSATHEALIGANVTIGNRVAITDIDGNFEIDVEDNFPLQIKSSYLGYKDIIKTVNNRLEKIEINQASLSQPMTGDVVVTAIKTGKTLINTIQKNDSVVLKGNVRDSLTKETLIGVNIITGTQEATSDINGYFEIKVKNKFPLDLKFSYIGYSNTTKTILNANEKIEVKLSPEALGNFDIKVTTKRQKNKHKH